MDHLYYWNLRRSNRLSAWYDNESKSTDYLRRYCNKLRFGTIGFYYGVTISTLIVQVIPPFFHARFLGQALQALDEHMATNKALSNSDSANTELLERVRAKIEKARGNSVGPAVVAAIVILCVIVMPPLASYMVPLMWALTALRLTADNIIYAPEN